ncbi:MAG TPA: OmpA family protein [Polyangiaceae bacterium]|jgi:peptidoglycan-associated lipoprotein
MIAKPDHPRLLHFAIAAALALVACGGEKQMQAASPPAQSPSSLGIANVQPIQTVPNTPKASNVAISEDVLRACNIPDADAYFAFDSAHLASFDHAPLDAVAICFTSGPMRGRKLHLVGHADPRGMPEYNMTLGQSRADAVAGYLTSKGVSSANVGSTSRGAQDATGRDETGWSHDRRVDVLLAD